MWVSKETWGGEALPKGGGEGVPQGDGGVGSTQGSGLRLRSKPQPHWPCLASPSFGFPICAMGIMMVPTWQGCAPCWQRPDDTAKEFVF